MKLLSLKITDRTERQTFYTIKVETGFFMKKLKTYDCVQEKGYYGFNYFLSTGKRVYGQFLWLEDVLNPLLKLDKDYENHGD